jgi:hypothetical protein
MNKIFKLLIISAIFFLVAAPTIPPPPGELDCSPGFYKNHTELWWHDSATPCCETQEGCELLESMLKARGPGSGAVRAFAAGELNACFEVDHELNPCED